RDNVHSYSYGYSRLSREIRVGRRLASAAGFQFLPVLVSPYLLDSLPRAMALNEGFSDLTQTRQATIWGKLPRQPVLVGHWGDVWTDDFGLADGDDGSLLRKTKEHFYRRGNAWLLTHLVRPNLKADPLAALDEVLEAGLVEFESIACRDMRLRLFKLATWAFRWTFPSLRAFAPVGAAVAPYADPRVIRFFASLQPQLLRDRDLQVRSIRKLAPELAKVEWQQTGVPLDGAARGDHLKSLLRRAQLRLLKEPQQNWQIQFGSR